MRFAPRSFALAALVALLAFTSVSPAWARTNAQIAGQSTCLETELDKLILNNQGVAQSRDLHSIKTLKVATYNVMNFFMSVGAHRFDETGTFRQVPGRDPQPIPVEQAQGVAKAILDMDPDILFCQEIEGGLETMNAFSPYLDAGYKPYLVQGNDPRGINIGLYIKNDLPITVEMRTHRDVKWTEPATQNQAPVFSRDLPVLILRDAKQAPNSEPLLILVGHHGKSMRDRPGDPHSNVMRTAQVQAAANVINSLKTEFGPQARIIFAGDMNTDVSAPEMAPIRTVAGMEEGFGLQKHPPPANERVTHTFHPEQGPTEAKQLDAVFVSQGLKDAVGNVSVYRYTDANGNPKPIPQTYQEREQNPSDHFPVLMELDFQRILQKLNPGP